MRMTWQVASVIGWKGILMIEAERFLQEKMQRAQKQKIADVDVAIEAEVERDVETGWQKLRGMVEPVPGKPLGIKWLKIVNYGLVPLNMLLAVIALVWLLGQERDEVVGGMIPWTLANLGLLAALFVGLHRRQAWGWWLLMAFLALKGPMKAWNVYWKDTLVSEIMNSIAGAGFGAGGSTVGFGKYILMALAIFVVVCLPQMVYFYNRRQLFNVRFEGERS